MNNSPKISIQIPTFNQSSLISKAVESALNQDYKNLEVIVSDDNSTDNTGLVIKKYLTNPNFKYFKNESNLGRVGNYRELLTNHVSGEWVVNLDADDYYIDNTFITTAVNEISKYQALGHKVVLYTTGIEVKSPKSTIKVVPEISDNITLLNGKDYFKNFFLLKSRSHLTTVFNRSEAKNVGFYAFNTLFTDLNSIIKLSLMGDVIINKNICGVWNIHENNESKRIEDYIALEIESRTEIAKFAEPFVGLCESNKWKKKAIEEIFLNILYKSLKYDKVNRKDWYRLIKYFKNSPFYYKSLLKYTLLSFKV